MGEGPPRGDDTGAILDGGAAHGADSDPSVERDLELAERVRAERHREQQIGVFIAPEQRLTRLEVELSDDLLAAADREMQWHSLFLARSSGFVGGSWS